MNNLIHTNCAICDEIGQYDIIYKSTVSEVHLNTEIFSARRIPDKLHYQIVKCKKCGLVRSSPVYKSANLFELYKISTFNYEAELPNLIKTYMEALLPTLKSLNKSAKIVEVGGGNGFILDEIRKSGFSDLVEVEPSEDAYEKSSANIKKSFKKAMFDKSLFSKESVDLVFTLQTFDHLSSPNKFLTDCFYILKKGGCIIAFNHDVESMSAKMLGEKSPIIDIEHMYLYSHKTMKQIFQKNGFEVEMVKSVNNTLSLRHLAHLTPLPKIIKNVILSSKNNFLQSVVRLPLGNLSLIAYK